MMSTPEPSRSPISVPSLPWAPCEAGVTNTGGVNTTILVAVGLSLRTCSGERGAREHLVQTPRNKGHVAQEQCSCNCNANRVRVTVLVTSCNRVGLPIRTCRGPACLHGVCIVRADEQA